MARLDKRVPLPGSDDMASSADPSPEIARAGSLQPALPAAGNAVNGRGEALSPDEVLAGYCRRVLLRQEVEAAVRARAFLESAGMRWSAASDLPIGLLDSVIYAREYVGQAGISLADWKRQRISPKLDGCLVGPIRDFSGEIVTFWARSTNPESLCYLFRDRWDRRPIAFGMDELSPGRPSHVFLVERILDALILRSWGVEPVLAFARRFDQVLPEAWGDLAKWGVLQATLIPVGPEVPAWVLQGARDQARRSTMRPELWLIPPRRIAPNLGRWAAELGKSAFLPWIREHRVPLLGRQSDVRYPTTSGKHPGPGGNSSTRVGKTAREAPPQAVDSASASPPNEGNPSGDGDQGMPPRTAEREIYPKHGGPLDGCFCFD
ncbi:MAG: hypothetical protein ACUVQQ_14025 [Thermogutta sp.]